MLPTSGYGRIIYINVQFYASGICVEIQKTSIKLII